MKEPPKQSTLEEIHADVVATSTCIVVDTHEIKEARHWIEIHNGKISTFFEDLSGKIWRIECSFKQFISQNIRAAREGDTVLQFKADAQRLASMLQKAANIKP